MTLRWVAATDDVSIPGNIVYDVCYSTGAASSGNCAANFVANVTTLGGATSTTVGSLTGATTYYFVVKARDQANNRDINTVERSAMTLDTTAPASPAPVTFTNVTGSSVTVADVAPCDLVCSPVAWSEHRRVGQRCAWHAPRQRPRCDAQAMAIRRDRVRGDDPAGGIRCSP